MTINVRQASENQLGVVKIGAGLNVQNGVVSLAGAGSEEYRYQVISNNLINPINATWRLADVNATLQVNVNTIGERGANFNILIKSPVDLMSLPITTNATRISEIANSCEVIQLIPLTIYGYNWGSTVEQFRAYFGVGADSFGGKFKDEGTAWSTMQCVLAMAIMRSVYRAQWIVMPQDASDSPNIGFINLDCYSSIWSMTGDSVIMSNPSLYANDMQFTSKFRTSSNFTTYSKTHLPPAKFFARPFGTR